MAKRVSDTIKMKSGKINLPKIKAEARKGTRYVFFERNGRECVILAQKYGPAWWKKATANDIFRVSPCERIKRN